MSQLVRLRVELADSPGSLATVAGVIARHGGNITAVDVQRSLPTTAVDEIVVDFPDDVELAQLRRAIADSGAATLLSHQSARRVDPVVQLLQRAVEVLRAPALAPEEALTAAVAELCSSPAVWVSTAGDADQYETGRFALKEHGAVTIRSRDVPPPLRGALPEGEVWLLAVPDLDLDGQPRVIFVARPLDLAFTATEISRIEALTLLYDELGRLREAAGSGG
jgi:hypothetical protein